MGCTASTLLLGPDSHPDAPDPEPGSPQQQEQGPAAASAAAPEPPKPSKWDSRIQPTRSHLKLISAAAAAAAHGAVARTPSQRRVEFVPELLAPAEQQEQLARQLSKQLQPDREAAGEAGTIKAVHARFAVPSSADSAGTPAPAAAAAGCPFQHQQQQQQQQQHEQERRGSRTGNEVSMRRIVDELYRRVLAHPELAPFFQGGAGAEGLGG
jgi:hypothetical protein